jgi:SEC-C motif domain protein
VSPTAAKPCPCGTGRDYDACCGRVHSGAAAATAEALMRSRYTAFALGDVGHLLRSWHSRTRPARLVLDPDQRWTGLTVLATSEGGMLHPTGTVEFEARWTGRAGPGRLHEVSRFVREDGRWVYLEG